MLNVVQVTRQRASCPNRTALLCYFLVVDQDFNLRVCLGCFVRRLSRLQLLSQYHAGVRVLLVVVCFSMVFARTRALPTVRKVGQRVRRFLPAFLVSFQQQVYMAVPSPVPLGAR